MMSNLSERDRRALRFLLVGGGAIVFLMVVGFPMLDQWDSLSRKVDLAEKKLQGIAAGVSEAAEAKQSLEKLKVDAALYEDRAGLSEQTPRIQLQLESVQGYRDLQINRLEGLPPREEDGFQRNGVTVQFSGNLRDLHRFLSGVEGAKPRLKVDRLTINVSQKDAAKIDGQMVISGYAVLVKKGMSG